MVAVDMMVSRRSACPSARGQVTTASSVTGAAVAAGALVVVDRGSSDGSNDAWSADLVVFAERSPLLLVDGWEVVAADERGDEGELTFGSGERTADLTWRTGAFEDWVADRGYGGEILGTHLVPDGTATIIRPDGSLELTALWPVGDLTLEFRMAAADLSDFEDLLDSLHVVDVDAWLSAMPASVVELTDRAAVIDTMLTGIPLPDGFDVAALADGPQVRDRYQLGAEVVGAVTCIWIRQWLDATTSGDDAGAQQAVDAMSDSSHWPVIEEMNESGAYGLVLQIYVDAMVAGRATIRGGPTVADSYQIAFGCSG